MTLRLMPRSSLAPYVGGGGSYNQILSSSNSGPDQYVNGVKMAESYWAGIAEAGLFIHVSDRAFLELGGRYYWSSSKLEDADYWTGRIGYGFSY